MGNRAVITTKERELALYLHWNGGRDTVEPLLRYCEFQGYRPPSADIYGWARMAQVMGNFFGGALSVGIDLFKHLRDQGDNGVYVIDGWKVVEHIGFDYDSDYNVVGWPCGRASGIAGEGYAPQLRRGHARGAAPGRLSRRGGGARVGG